MIKMSTDAAWLKAKAEKEGNGIVSVGGLAVALAREEEAARERTAERVALARLIELRRRQYRLSAEELAKQADIGPEEVVSIERGSGAPGPQTLHRLAQVLQLPERKLHELAGLGHVHDTRLRQATVRFAARAEPLASLLPEEQQALEEYVKVLAEP